MDETITCPWCAEEILAAAKKCKHCGEFLADTPTAAHPAPPPPVAEAPTRSRAVSPPPAPRTAPIAQPQATNGIATAAMVCGIVGVCLFWTVIGGLVLGVLAVIFGFIGRTKPLFQGRAASGIVLGTIAVVISIGFVVALNSAEDKADKSFRCTAAAIGGTVPDDC